MRAGVFENFMLPQRDLFGFCDNFKSASFLRSVDAETEGSCVQTFTFLSDAAESYLNPIFYEKRQYLTGSNDGSTASSFSRGKLFRRDSATGEVEELPSSTNLASPTVDLAACTVTNFVREVFYRVFYSENDNGLYTIDSI